MCSMTKNSVVKQESHVLFYLLVCRRTIVEGKNTEHVRTMLHVAQL